MSEPWVDLKSPKAGLGGIGTHHPPQLLEQRAAGCILAKDQADHGDDDQLLGADDH